MDPRLPTRAALLTAPGRAGIAVIAIRGPAAWSVAGAVFRARESEPATIGQLHLGHLIDGQEVIDEAILCRWADRVEINIHSGPAVTRAALEAIKHHGVEVDSRGVALSAASRPAHADWGNPAIGQELLEALPAARSMLAVRAVSAQWSAGLSRLACQVLAALSRPLAKPAAEELAGRLIEAGGRWAIPHRLLHPAEVVLAGPPNAGKSTLANALVGRPVSIVDEQPGTTRDWVRELALLEGAPIWLTDTAGLWEQAEGVDAEAVRRAQARASAADLVLLLTPGPTQTPSWLAQQKLLSVWSKADLVPAPPGCLAVSGTTGQGLPRLSQAVRRSLGLEAVDPQSPMAFTERQKILLERGAAALQAADMPAARAVLTELLGGAG